MKITILLIALSSLISCRAQESNQTTTINKNKMERPNITPEFEKLYLEDYKDGLIIEEAVGTVAPDIGVKFKIYYYKKINDAVSFILSGTLEEGFSSSFTPKDSNYTIGKSYYL